MLPLWLQYYAERSARYFRNAHLPLPTLLLLLREIGQFQTGRDFLLIEPPRSRVFHPGTGMYLFYPKAHRQLVSFELRRFDLIHSLGLRYRDPLNIKSGVDARIVSGWMGVAQLIESAVNSSPFFGKLQTIETSSRAMERDEQTYTDADEAHLSTYDIWVEARRSWSIGWEADEPEWDEDGRAADPYYWGSSGSLLHSFYKGQRVLLARVTVERARAYPDFEAEIVHKIELYPEIECSWDMYWHGDVDHRIGRPLYHLRENGRRTATTCGAAFPADHLSDGGWIPNMPPHSDMQVSYTG